MQFARSLFTQALGALLVTMGICMTVLLIAASDKIDQKLEDNFSVNAVNLTEFTANQINTGTRLKRGAMIEPQITALLSDDGIDIVAIRVVHQEGVEVINQVADGFDQTLSDAHPTPTFGDASVTDLNGQFLTVTTPILLGSGADRILVGEVSIIWDTAPLQASLSSTERFLTQSFAATALLVVLVMGLVLYVLVRRPLSAVVKSLSAVSIGRDDVELPKGSSSETAEMIRTIDVFLSQTKERNALLADLKDVIVKGQNGDFSARLSVEGHENSESTNAYADGLRRTVDNLLETVEVGLNETMRAMAALSKRDMTARMVGDFDGAFKTLSGDVNFMADELSSTISQVFSTARDVEDVANKLSGASEDLSSRTNLAAATLQETSAAISQISDAVTDAAAFTSSAKSESDQVTGHARTGKDVMDGLIEKMTTIQEHSTKVSDIVTLIEDVAFQTSLLSLNASVEAARAGEHGKGFAVVASEVRALAQRTTESASMIKDLVVTSSLEIENGVEKANEAGHAIGEIDTAIQSLTTKITEISRMSQDQASKIEEIRGAVSELDTTTQQNAEMVNNTLSLSSDLKSGSASMLGVLSQFEVDQSPIVHQDWKAA